MNIKVIQLPSQFKDPDDCIQNDPQLFKQAIRQAIHIIDFFFESITGDLDLQRVEHKKKAVKNLLPVLLKITDTIEQAHYVQKLADLVQVETTIIQQALARAKSALRTPAYAPGSVVTAASPTQTKPSDRYAALSREVIAIVLGLPDQFKYCLDYLDPAYLTDEASAELYKRMTDYYNNNAVFDESKYLEQHRDDAQFIDMLHLLRADSIPDADRQILQEQMISVIRELHKGYVVKRLRQLERQIKQAEQKVDATQTEQLLQEFQMLTNQLTELS
jgi:DNA primase